MKAIRVHKFGGPEVLQLDEVPDPTPGPGQVVVRVRAAGVNPVDTYVRSGSYAMLPTLPYIPGNDAAGVVEAVGAGVTRFQKGDRVYVVRTTTQLCGAYAELALCDAAILGLALWNASPEEMASIHAALGAGLANGTLRPVVGQELPLKEAARAQEAVLKPGAYGKIVLIP